jgi:3-mercaptopyruvate sulfurtransferase SseA
MGPLVTAAWLAGALGSPDLAVLDATYYLPNEGKDARALFAAAHIAGANFFDVDSIADTTSALPHMLPSPAQFAAAVSALAVSNTSRIVVYDQRGIFSSARAWWMFRVFGHDAVFVLDGGLPTWQAAGARCARRRPFQRLSARAAPRHEKRSYSRRQIPSLQRHTQGWRDAPTSPIARKIRLGRRGRDQTGRHQLRLRRHRRRAHPRHGDRGLAGARNL